MIINATVIRSTQRDLLVREDPSGSEFNFVEPREILVHYRNAGQFSAGDRVIITFNGQMTHSIPPQITATSVLRRRPEPEPPRPGPSELRAVITAVGRGTLMVRDTRSGQQFRVEFPQSHHFCARQQVIIRYDTITMHNPPRLTAVDIIPVC